jgi:pyruvate/2-oxoglutarate dehydrogenase complex dihydrolipoamide dehydrogenase (E3) component
MGDLANLQGRAAGSTGLSESNARRLGYDDIVTVINASPDKPGFMEGKLLADRKTGRILGAQCIGPGNVNRQIAQWAMAIQGHLTVEDVVNADHPYAPPLTGKGPHGLGAGRNRFLRLIRDADKFDIL